MIRQSLQAIVSSALLLALAACGDREDRPAPVPAPADASRAPGGEITPPASFSYDDRIGWSDGACLAVASPSLKVGVPVRLVPLDSEPLLDATIASGPMSPGECDPRFAERSGLAGDREVSLYRLAGLPPDFQRTTIAIVDPPPGLSLEGGRSRADLDGDGRLETFSVCTASEGLSFEVRSEGVAKPRWTGYYALGYDLEPNCPPLP